MTNKTIPTSIDVEDFLASAPTEQAVDAQWLITTMSDITGEPAVMWGSSIVGFGKYHYKYESGREGDMPLLAFSPRKGKFALYITYNAEQYEEELKQIGKHQTSKACIYFKRLKDINVDKLHKLIQTAYDREASKL